MFDSVRSMKAEANKSSIRRQPKQRRTGNEQRDSELELRIRGVLGTDLPVESDLTCWFPLWDLPVA